MKTTIEIDDALLVEAKKKAAELHRPLRVLVEEGLRLRLAAPEGDGKKRIKWVVAEGGVPDAVRDRDALYDWLGDKP